jgi:L-lactate dehydrogenase complex protein LldG
VGQFETVIGRIRQSLNPGATAEAADARPEPQQITPAHAASADELRAQFIAALDGVGGHAIDAVDQSAALAKIIELMRSLNIRSVATGEGITTDSASAAAQLAGAGLQLVRVGEHDGAALKERLAAIDAGLVEADYGIASTGTLAMVGMPQRPRSLSLLPPINIVMLRAARILPDLAAVLRAVGPQRIAAHPMVLVTGPSRTADIEKRIVIGVHGPKELYVVIIADSAGAGGSSVAG